LHVLIEANVEDPSGALSAVPDAASRIGVSREELWPKIEMMTYKQFRQEVVPFLPAATADTIDEQTFEDLRMSVWERVDHWLRDAADKLDGQDQS
jgi:hypothetical protein